MRRAAKHAGKYVLLLILLVCLGHIFAIGTTISSYGTPVIYYLNDTYSLNTVQEMRKNDSELENYLPFTAVGNMDQQTFSNDDLGKSLTCTLTYIDGNSENLCTSDGELLEDDLTGCMLSTQAAWELFGESHIAGGHVTYNDKTYTVRGVYDDTNAIVILPAASIFAQKKTTAPNQDQIPADTDADTGNSDDTMNTSREVVFNKIVIKPGTEIGDSATRTEYLQAFENRWSLNNNKTDCLIYQRLAAFFMFLLPVLMLLVPLIAGIRWIIINRYRPFWLITALIGLIIFIVAFFTIFQVKPSIPADLIPNTWSDFDFWSEKIKTLKNSIQHILFMDKSEVELGYFKPLTAMAGYSIAAIILFFVIQKWFKPSRLKALYGMIVAVCITELVAVYILHRTGVSIEGKRMLLYLWPYFVIGQFAFCRKKEKVAEKTVDLPKKTC